ncbi:MAG: 4Fe-4S dicluster domain-containing protein [Candidatus Metalachnospira sp.]|nr:4Fe-4S dicluster domain-containing protein [Candidatus Metalachnospira sp.]
MKKERGFAMEASMALKDRIKQFCFDAGADIIGFASAERWNEINEVPFEFRPQSLWEPTKTVIVMGVGMPLPIVETTPSILHKETYDTANRTLDSLAFNLTRFLNRLGEASYFFTRDGFGSLRLLKDRPMAAFNHITAARYAGLGTVGVNNCLLTPEFGPRVRLVSVFTAAALEPDPILEKELCIKCGACVKCCPVDALIMSDDKVKGDFVLSPCLDRHIELSHNKAYPCGICTKVCPIGKDRILYPQKGIMKLYLQEEEALAADPDDPRYRSWTHVRKYGSWNKDYPC